MFKKTKVRDLLGRHNIAEVQAVVLEVRQVIGGYFRAGQQQAL